MSDSTRLVRLVYTVVDVAEVAAIEPQGKKSKRTTVHLRGGQSLVVPLGVGTVHEAIWGEGIWPTDTWPSERVPIVDFGQHGVKDHGQPPLPPVVMGTDRLRADPDELAEADEEHDNAVSIRHEQQRLLKKLDTLIDDGSISKTLTPMFPKRQLIFGIIEARYPEDKYALQKLVDSFWFAQLANLKENDPRSCSSIIEATRIVMMKPGGDERIFWALSKTRKALKDLDWFWGRGAYEHTEKLEKFLEEHQDVRDC